MSSGIPDKVYYKIGEVAEIVGVETHVLRFWESEFPHIKPSRASSNQRLYRRRDLDVFLEIKKLLYEEKYTIAGARKCLGRRSGKSAREKKAGAGDRPDLGEIRAGLMEIKTILEKR